MFNKGVVLSITWDDDSTHRVMSTAVLPMEPSSTGEDSIESNGLVNQLNRNKGLLTRLLAVYRGHDVSLPVASRPQLSSEAPARVELSHWQHGARVWRRVWREEPRHSSHSLAGKKDEATDWVMTMKGWI